MRVGYFKGVLFMIIRVALKIGNNILIGKKNARHDSLYTDEVVRLIRSQKDKGVQGFITDSGDFLNRYDAGKHAAQCGQMDRPCCLVSEDLW